MGKDTISSVGGGILSTLGLIVLLTYAFYVSIDIVSKQNYILDEHQLKIGGLQLLKGKFTGNQTCYPPECEVPTLLESIPVIFNNTLFRVNPKEGTAVSCKDLNLELLF